MIGYTILLLGADLATKQLSEIVVLAEKAFSVSGIMPNNELIVGLAQWFYGKQISYTMVLGMGFHLLIARYTRMKHIFLTGHHILFMAALITGIISGTSLTFYVQVVIGAILLACTLSILPKLNQPMMNEIYPDNTVGMAHFGTIGFIFSSWVAKKTGKKPDKLQANKEVKSDGLRYLSNPNVIILVFMFSFILFLLLFTGREFFVLQPGVEHVLIYALKSSLLFTAGMYIIIMGVRLLLTEVLVSFEGIASKLVPNAIPALDSPIIFPFAPQAVVLGFFSSLLGGLLGMVILINLQLKVILPAMIAHFFSGGTTGVFGYTVGGYRGATIGAFVHGLIITFLPLLLMPTMNQLGYTQTTFSETDFGIIGVLLYNFFKFLGLY